LLAPDLLLLQGRNIGGGLYHMDSSAACGDESPLDEQALFAFWQQRFAGRQPLVFYGLRHFAELTGRGTAGNLLMAGLAGDVA